MAFGMDGLPAGSSEMSLSASLSPSTIAAVAATSSTHFPATTEAWATYPAPDGASPNRYGDSLPVIAGGSGSYHSDTEWSAGRNSFPHSPVSGFDLPMHDSGVVSHGYNTPYNYSYNGDFETAASPFLDANAGSVSNGHRRRSVKLESSSAGRTRRRYPLSPPPPPSVSSKSSAASKLRSASRASKNNHLNPPATEEERKNRASHNQVEKQYRNRLNAHFEALLNTLPDYMRGGEDDEEDGDRKISKAEVLEMARRYIISIERDYAAIEEERDELKDSVERLRWLVARSEEEKGKRILGTGGV